MLTPEQAELLRQEQVMLEYAEMDQAKAQEKMNQYYNAIKKVSDAMSNASDDQREKIANMLSPLIQWYRTAERERGSAEDKYWQHINNINEYKALDVAQQPTQWRAQRETITPPDPETIIENGSTWWPIVIPTQVPEGAQKIIANQPWNPFGSITEWQWISTADYLNNVYQWWSENINPQTWVYQNNSRAPWYNLWRKLWNATIPLAVMGWTWVSPSTFWVNEGALDNAKSALFRSNINKLTNAPSQPYTVNPSNIPIKRTSPSNLPRYYTAPSNAPTINVLRSNPSNIAITPTSMTRFTIPGPSITL